MPRRYRGRKGKKGPRRHRKYRKATIPRTVTVRGVTGMADRLKVKLRYCDTRQYIAGSSFIWQFRGNSCFDPDLTFAGHQPYLYDQYITMYQRYRVYGSSIRVDISNASATTTVCALVYPAADNSTSAATISHAAELPRSGQMKMVGIQQRFPAMIKRYASTAQVLGYTKQAVRNDDTTSALYTSNPLRLWYWDIVTESADLAAVMNCLFVVKLTYYVEFFDPFINAQS